MQFEGKMQIFRIYVQQVVAPGQNLNIGMLSGLGQRSLLTHNEFLTK